MWLPGKDEVWIPGQVVQLDYHGHDLLLTISPEGSVGERVALEVHVKSNDDLPPLRNPDLLVGANDLTTLSHLHEPAGMLAESAIKLQWFPLSILLGQ